MAIRSIHKVFVLLCLGALWLLATTAIVQHATGRAERNFSVSGEKRNPTPPPNLRTLPAREWGRNFDAFFNDRFPCRRTWIKNYRSIFVKKLLSPYAGRVPGKGRYEFYTGDISELESYMGICSLTDAEIDDWVTIFEGRKAWTEAMGMHYFQLIIPYRAFIDEEFLPDRLRRQRRISTGQQVFQASRGGRAADNVLFPVDFLLDAKQRTGEPCYYKKDSHFSPYGIFLIYQLMNEKIREAFPSVQQISPPGTRTSGDVPFPRCRIDGKALVVDYPGEVNIPDDYYLTIRDTGFRYPEKNVMTRRPDEGLQVLLSNDSMIRLSLASWTQKEGNVHLPFGHGIQEVKSFMWRSLSPGLLDSIVTEKLPDVWIEEMLEDRLKRLHFKPNGALLNAAAYGAATPLPGQKVPDRPGDFLHLLAVLERPVSRTQTAKEHDMLPVPVRFYLGDECVHEETTYQGVRRAVFSAPIRIGQRHRGKSARVEIDGETTSTSLSLRLSKEKD